MYSRVLPANGSSGPRSSSDYVYLEKLEYVIGRRADEQKEAGMQALAEIEAVFITATTAWNSSRLAHGDALHNGSCDYRHIQDGKQYAVLSEREADYWGLWCSDCPTNALR